MNNTNEEFTVLLKDFIELLDYTLSAKFVEKWRHKYSEKFVKHFQIRLLKSMQAKRVLKLSTLFTYLHKKCDYCKDQVINFLESVDIEAYQPFIAGYIEEVR